MMLHGTGRAAELMARNAAPVTFRPPRVDDGIAVSNLITACPPLDQNSVYCNILQCTDFADTCLLAVRDSRVVGWVSGYRPPNDPAAMFIWQVAVHPEARGLGLAKEMVLALLRRPACRTAARIKTTVTPDNAASWALFESVADALNARFCRQPLFDAVTHFRGRHASEHLAIVGPLTPS